MAKKKPVNINDVFLQPGEFHFGDRNTRIRTLLGSCVSIIMWHEKHMIGGMCHYLLPTRGLPSQHELDGRYADEAIELFMRKIHASHTNPGEYQVKIFGGGNMFPQQKEKNANCGGVPCKNALAARELVKRYNLNLTKENLGGLGHRQVIFNVWSGEVFMRQMKVAS